jgi:CRP-like cAMP-binding protein
MTWEFHAANVLFLVSYAVKDILWLRLVVCVASVATMAAMAAAAPSPPAVAFAWQSVFLVINFARLLQLVHERRSVPLGPDARRLATSVFAGLRPRALLRLLAVGEVVDHAAGAEVVRRGQSLDHLAVVVEGRARVQLETTQAVELGDGAFIGELSYLTGKPPGADVVAATPLRIVRWPCAALRDHLEANPDTRTVMQLVLGADLASKLRGRANRGQGDGETVT